MKLDFNFAMTDLDGKTVQPEQNAGKLLAVSLTNQPRGNALKFYEWALALNAGKAIDLDTSDRQLLRKFIEDCEAMTVLAKGQMLHTILKAEALP